MDDPTDWVDELLAVVNRGDRHEIAERLHAEFAWRAGQPDIDADAEEPRDDVETRDLESLLEELNHRSGDGQRFAPYEAGEDRETADDLLVAFVAKQNEDAEADADTDVEADGADPKDATLVVDCETGLVTEWWMEPLGSEES